MLHVAWQNVDGNTSWRIHSPFINTILIEAIQMPTVRKMFLMPVQSQPRDLCEVRVFYEVQKACTSHSEMHRSKHSQKYIWRSLLLQHKTCNIKCFITHHIFNHNSFQSNAHCLKVAYQNVQIIRCSLPSKKQNVEPLPSVCDVLSAITPFVGSTWKFGIAIPRKKLSRKREFCENRLSNFRTSLKDAFEFPPVFPTFLDRSQWNSV
jgi:hypothetical protein